ncbi:hypothetical protein HD806DRAFT_337217 [Xylariaceae sp. AK1471]|nr:hypothetical protein HD806DRAFT_337217 [Xylariaceae sp. AK1471]
MWSFYPLPRELKSPQVLVPGAIFFYLILVRGLRYRRRDGFMKAYKRKYGSCDRKALSKMAIEDAWIILKELTELEFPSIFSASVFFALFKTYGIPTISRLLVATGQLASDTTASKRATDTGVLISEFVLNPPDSARKYEAIARMNYLHERYRKAGKISDADMLYTLSLFALEPVRWANRYDWRRLTDVERAAMGVFWRDMGEAMSIPYDILEPYVGERRDGLDWLEAIDQWSMTYEEKYMVPAGSNEKLGWGTLNVLLFNTPTWLRGFTLKLVSAVLEDRLRAAMRIEEPGRIHRAIVNSFLTLRAWTVRYTHLPRPSWLRNKFFTDDLDPKTGKYHTVQYIAHPWYMKPTFWSRWGFEALRTRVWGGHLPGDQGMMFQPDGYHIAEIGPEPQRGGGKAEMEKIKAQLKEKRRAQGGCPMSAFRKV